jgi:hypothetical protein
MTTKGECSRCGAKGKVYECMHCVKSFCKRCVKKSLTGSPKCPDCERHLQ